MTREVSQSLGGLQNLPIIVKQPTISSVTKLQESSLSLESIRTSVQILCKLRSGGDLHATRRTQVLSDNINSSHTMGGCQDGINGRYLFDIIHTIRTRKFILTSGFPYQIGMAVISYSQTQLKAEHQSISPRRYN
jgi:hypothetical protein